MNALAAQSAEAVANFAWACGALCGLIVDVAIVLAIAQAPRLRDFRVAPASKGFVELRLLKLLACLVPILWFAGLCLIGAEALTRYAVYSAAAASIVIGLLLLPLIAKAASDVARRSVP